MEEPNEERAAPSLAQQFGFKGKKKLATSSKRKTQRTAKKKPETVTVEAEAEDSAGATNDGGDPTVRISLFDHSVENFFEAMDGIAKLCGEEEDANFEQSEIQRLSSSVTFLREWRHFNYPPRSFRFACRLGSPDGKDAISCINLPQFSSATVPKKEVQLGDAKSQESSRDFVMYVGGPVWALDWCPRIHEKPDCSVKCEFIAVAAHPPGDTYHKMGGPLIGRGVIQIWCLLNKSEKDEEISPPTGKREKRSKKDGATSDKSREIKRPRGRPRKNPTKVAVDDMNCETQYVQALAVQFPENSSRILAPQGVPENNDEVSPPTQKRKRGPEKGEGTNEKSTQTKKPRGRPKKNSNSEEVAVGDKNCENQFVQALAVQFLDNSSTILAPDGIAENNDEVSTPARKRKGVPKKGEAVNDKSIQTKKSRERPKKNSKEVAAGDPDFSNQHVQARAVQFPEDSFEFLSPDGVPSNCEEYVVQEDSGTNQKSAKKAAPCNPMGRAKCNSRKGKHKDDKSPQLLIQCENAANNQPQCSSDLDPLTASCSIPGDVNLPRIVSCLAHNGKVAWDVKWRPLNVSELICKHILGYLAVLLGNGSLEVWEVPLPRALKAIYMHGDATDPRFIKLEPVFKCSVLKHGGIQSIPLTVEWSVSTPHDYLLAGCHDGTVALWKFSPNVSSKCDDTKPLLCFRGDTVPIRAVAWAPFKGDPESSNIIVTAGHEGLKFWDIRDPFRPLRELHLPRIVYSLDWLSNPSCIIMSFEDGTMRTLSLVKAANDLLVNGVKYSGKKQPGLHSFPCSSFAIWSVQVSRITGMVAYCGADGTVLRFQLTTKGVETDHARNRVPHFHCGSVTLEESTLTINTHVPNKRFPLKKSFDKGRHAQSSFRGFVSESNLNEFVNNQMARASNCNSQTLALCDGEDLGVESGSEEALASVESPKKKKLNGSKKKPVDSQALVCRDDETRCTLEGDDEKLDVGSVAEAFPPKMVALHRVRWNMNKGSERWLCYGGAGGFVRCQEIVFSDIDKKWAKKR